MNKALHHFLCADCGRETTIATDDPGFGLCGRCESRLNSLGKSWNHGKEKPRYRAVGPGEEKPSRHQGSYTKKPRGITNYNSIDV